MRHAPMNFEPADAGEFAPELQIVGDNPSWFRTTFPKWLADNLHIWREFKAQIDSLWDAGRAHYSSRTVVEWMRHETTLAEVESRWKINDHAAPDLARLWVCLHPDRVSFFEF